MAEDQTEHGQVSDETLEEEGQEATTAHTADRPPTADEEAAVEGRSLDRDVREHVEDMAERGAHVEGEGRIS